MRRDALSLSSAFTLGLYVGEWFSLAFAVCRKMRSMKLLCIALFTTLAFAASAQGVHKESKAERDARMKWWREARFGMFIHWGLYAVPAGKWGNRTGYGEWIMESAQIPVDDYRQFVDQFNPVQFNAKEWARMAKDAGMRYITITTKHHDGFALYDSKVSDYDVMATPFKRDIMKELAEATRAEGLTMCWYHSIMDWHHPDYEPHRAWSTPQPADANFARYEKYLHDQVSELLTNYGPIGVMWFDGEWERTWNHERGSRLDALCRKLQPKVIVNNRVDVGRGGMAGMSDAGFAGDFGTPEQEIPAQGIPGVDWESCMTMNTHWGYNAWDKNYKSTTELIRNLVDIVSKGGNYLLNVGPKADGTFPEESVVRLKEIGQWMKVNSEAIYATHASPFKSLPWGRATMKPGKSKSEVFLHVFDWPSNNKLVVPGVGNEVISAQVLGHSTNVIAKKTGGDVVIDLPKGATNPHATVVKLTLKGMPIIYATPEIVTDSDQFVTKLSVKVNSGSGELVTRYTLDGSAPTANSPVAKGSVEIAKSSTLKVRSFHNGKAVSGVAERKFTKVQPWAASDAPAAKGFKREVYFGDWDKCPNWDSLSAEKSDAIDVIGLGEYKDKEHVGFRITGSFKVLADDVYRFSLLADDGAKLWIDGKLVVDHDGLHSPSDKMGTAPLAKGWHRITVEWFNKTGGAALDVRMSRLGEALAGFKPDMIGH